jgi:hypothetical protein
VCHIEQDRQRHHHFISRSSARARGGDSILIGVVSATSRPNTYLKNRKEIQTMLQASLQNTKQFQTNSNNFANNLQQSNNLQTSQTTCKHGLNVMLT